MRARLGLAQCLWAQGQHDEAISHYWELLRLNENDNQGVSYILAAGLAELGDDEELGRLLSNERFAGDASAAWRYTVALLAFRTRGDALHARRMLARAVAANRHVPAFLIGRRTPGALAWLAARVAKAVFEPRQR